jgi:hypothetical protein
VDVGAQYVFTRMSPRAALMHAVFLPILLLVFRRLWPDFDDRARAAGMLLGPASYNFQMEGKTVLVDERALPQGLTSSRAGCAAPLRARSRAS